MQRILITSLLILLLVVGAAGVAPTAHAQAQDVACQSCLDACQASYGSDTAGANACQTACAPQCGGDTSISNQSSAPDAATQKTEKDSQDTAYNGVMIRIMGLFAWLLGVAAVTLDYAVYYTVVKMGTYVKDLTAVGVAWRILRDLGNIALIFGFLAIGISTIIGSELYGWGQKLLPRLLMAAVALNFSLFITEAIIDGGNLFATQFYTQIKGGTLPTSASLAASKIDNIQNEGISNKIMAQLGMQNIYGEAIRNEKIFAGTNQWFIGFMGILLFITASFVMFSLAFILIARFVALIFIIIAAPIGVVGFAVPRLEAIGKSWRDQLFEQTITAPILLLMLYIALAIITDVHFLTGFGSGGTLEWNGTLTGNLPGFAGAFLSFLVAMGLLLAVTMYAKKMGAWGVDVATKFGSKASFGVAAWGGRATLGGLGRGLDSRVMRSWASKNTIGGFLAKGTAFTGRRLENRTYDIRNIKTAQGLLSGSAVGFNTGVAPGSSVTAKEAYNKTIEKAKYIKPFTGDWWRDQQKEYEKAAAERDRKEKLATPGTSDFTKAIKKMSVDELAELRGIRKGLESFVVALSPAKYAELQKSDKLIKTEKEEIKKNWEDQFVGAKAAPMLHSFTTEEIATLDSGLLTKVDVMDNLGPTELDAIRRKGALKQPERNAVYKHMTATPGSALDTAFRDYLAKDLSGGREKYWNV